MRHTKQYSFFVLLFMALFLISASHAYAVSEITTRPSTPHQETPASSAVNKTCPGKCGKCNCQPTIEKNHVEIRDHKTAEFVKHRKWMIDELWKTHVLPAMGMMASQLTAGAVQQVFIIGTFFDAKHQLETQRIFQQLMAEAHRDYMPSEGVCEVGTAARSLAASDRKTPLAQTILSERSLDRQLRAKDTIAGSDLDADIKSRIAHFAKNNCSANDNAGGLEWLCKNTGNANGSGGRSNAQGNNNNPQQNTPPNIATANQGATGNTAAEAATQNNNTSANSGNTNQQSDNNINPVNLNSNNGGTGNSNNNQTPRFSVRGQLPNGGNNQTIFDYRTINFNIGNHFNNLSGRFTVPQNGRYTFTATVTMNNPDEIAVVSLRKNSQSIFNRAGTRVGVQNIRFTTNLELERGDRITLFSNSRLGSGNHTFTGALISSNDGDGNGVDNAGDNNNPPNDPAVIAQKENRNKDVDFTRAVLSKSTLDIDITKAGESDRDNNGENEEASDGAISKDAQALFALSANLFGHKPLAFAPAITIADENGQPKTTATRYLDLRSIAAKRSVGQNSFAAITAERFSGDEQAAPYIRKILEELGIKPDEMNDFLGEKPSYNAQMEVLTKRIAQNPTFYTELYDKPANVLRKQAMLRAINLMQERDLYKSQLRQEMALAVALETMLHDEDTRVRAAIDGLSPGGRPAFNE